MYVRVFLVSLSPFVVVLVSFFSLVVVVPRCSLNKK